MVLWGMVCPHIAGDPTILPVPKLQQLLVRLRIEVLAGNRCTHH